MRDDLEAALFADFPNLYWRHTLPMAETAMCWGICTGDGWEPLIRRLSIRLTKMTEGLGLDPSSDEFKSYMASQVKEKLGGLRFYMQRSTPEMRSAISEAATESMETCDVCGGKGEMSKTARGWLVTRCGRCAPAVESKGEGEQ
ncbi:hypothetical protein BOTBODRAFT_522355 [Botryobasidium botryosum FD-172 SS1]|uniref:Uncharacterized protein n=1 Tax=Botryobasidium botryosum (strain FD-172 SS1) TaxID=930990 RepID=A0A067M1I7_BOTB1|nr:hypothetical protein BOTBODRAFT_522355 [Botryobasidium botryosum FD-172 SS1]